MASPLRISVRRFVLRFGYQDGPRLSTSLVYVPFGVDDEGREVELKWLKGSLTLTPDQIPEALRQKLTRLMEYAVAIALLSGRRSVETGSGADPPRTPRYTPARGRELRWPSSRPGGRPGERDRAARRVGTR